MDGKVIMNEPFLLSQVLARTTTHFFSICPAGDEYAFLDPAISRHSCRKSWCLLQSTHFHLIRRLLSHMHVTGSRDNAEGTQAMKRRHKKNASCDMT